MAGSRLVAGLFLFVVLVLAGAAVLVVVVVVYELPGHGRTQDPDLHPGGDLHDELVVFDLPDGAVDAADREDLVADVDALEQILLLALAALLRADQQEVEDHAHEEEWDEEGARTASRAARSGERGEGGDESEHDDLLTGPSRHRKGMGLGPVKNGGLRPPGHSVKHLRSGNR